MAKCAKCGTKENSLQEALQYGWLETFYDVDGENGPLCPVCTRTYVTWTKDRKPIPVMRK